MLGVALFMVWELPLFKMEVDASLEGIVLTAAVPNDAHITRWLSYTMDVRNNPDGMTIT